MVEAIYLLCALTSLCCAVLLARGYARTRMRLLLWSCLCFVAFTVNNALVIVDVMMLPEHDLSLARSAAALCGVAILLYGLVWDSEA